MSDPKYDKLKEENYWMYQYEVALKDDHERLRKAIEEMEFYTESDTEWEAEVHLDIDEDNT